VDLVTLEELLGHSTITVTMRYAHTNDEAKAKAVSAVSGDSVRMVAVIPKPRRKMG
jgi:integrase